MKIIDAYASLMSEDTRRRSMASCARQGSKRSASPGRGVREGKKHYYRVQGPTFLIEYDNSQNNGNHIHSVWRDFDGDFGRVICCAST